MSQIQLGKTSYISFFFIARTFIQRVQTRLLPLTTNIPFALEGRDCTPFSSEIEPAVYKDRFEYSLNNGVTEAKTMVSL